MNFFADAFAYIFTGAHWSGENGIGPRLVEHLVYTGISVLIAIVIAVPIGLAVGHTGRGRNAVVAVTGAARAIPTFGLLLFIVFLYGLGLVPLVVVLVILAIPPLLAGVYAGIESIDRGIIDAARAVGMSEWQILGGVEIPLGLPLMIGGLRSAVLQVIATATIAAYVGLDGLGGFLIDGLAVRDYTIAIVGAILVAALALVIDAILALIQKLVVPRGVSRGTAGTTRSTGNRSNRPRTAIRMPITQGEGTQ